MRAAYLADRDILAANVYGVEELRLAKGIAHARVSAAGGATLIALTQDTAWRFFPAIADPEFGWRLHDAQSRIEHRPQRFASLLERKTL